MKCTYKEQETCDVEKLGCEGCAYNDKIKVGEYYRLNNGYIGVCTGDEIFDSASIKKHSTDVLDLIENRDVLEFYDLQDKSIGFLGIDANTVNVEDSKIYEEMKEYVREGKAKILSILTHEQFDYRCFKLETLEEDN